MTGVQTCALPISGQNAEQVVQYLQKENLFPSMEAELKSKKTIEFLLSQAKIEEK